jgi:hypothetical protein
MKPAIVIVALALVPNDEGERNKNRFIFNFSADFG